MKGDLNLHLWFTYTTEHKINLWFRSWIFILIYINYLTALNHSLSRFAWLNPWYNPYKILLVSSICSRFRDLYYVIYFTCFLRIWINIYLSNLFSYPINYTLYVVIRSCDNMSSLWINGNLGIKKYLLFIVLPLEINHQEGEVWNRVSIYIASVYIFF